MDSGHVETRRSATAAVVPLLLGALLIAGVGFALYRWSVTPKYAAPAATQPTSAPSGAREAMPVGDIPGWHQVFTDDFTGQAPDLSKWRVYSGQPGGDPAGWFDPGHVAVRDRMLTISGHREASDGGKWATGGVSSTSLAQTYGKYLVHFRMDPGVGIGHALLLMPADGSWPPEIDFSETNGSGNNNTMATLHYGASDHMIWSRHLPVNLTQWHTLGLEWTPGRLRFTIDGRVWWDLRSSHVPAVPMNLALQTQAWPCVGTWGHCPDASTPATVRMYVDWVVAYAPAGSRG